MTRHRVTAALQCTLLGALLTSCASQGMPPGGPKDKAAPTVVKVTPDSGAERVTARAITIKFNEVVSERAKGGDLTTLFVLSPSDGRARVSWERNEIVVRPRHGFRANTAYSVTLMPGVSDLSGNVTTKPRTFVFSTGTGIPTTMLRGAVFDWMTLKPVSGALIDARPGTDTTFRWIARTDSLGRYTIPLLPPGTYLIRAIVDANSNGKLEPREAWDSASAAITDSARTDLYAFSHDTLGTRVMGVDVKDSLTLKLTFDRALALSPLLTAEQVTVKAADSSVVPVLTLGRASVYDSLMKVRDAAAKDSAQRADTTEKGRTARARADSARVLATRDSIEKARVEAKRAALDTVPKEIPPVPNREAITTEFVIGLGKALVPGQYRVAVRDAVSISGVTRSSERGFTREKPKEKKEEADSTSKKPARKPAAPPPPKPPAR